MATVILLSSKGTTVPLRLITRNCPGAVADSRVGLGFLASQWSGRDVFLFY